MSNYGVGLMLLLAAMAVVYLTIGIYIGILIGLAL